MIYIYIHPFSKTLLLEKYIYIYIYLLFSYLFFCFRVVKTKDVYMYIYFSRCNVFENGCVYIYIYIYIYIFFKRESIAVRSKTHPRIVYVL